MSKHLTIRELARETGVAPTTLRAWEKRYGFPLPRRAPSGHRSYGLDDADAIRAVLAARDAGTTLSTAIDRVRDAGFEPPQSIFAQLRRRHSLETHVVSKPSMTALSRALEDECSARAERGLLLGAFQERRFYLPVAARWRDLARAARRTIVVADFERIGGEQDGVVEVPLAPGSPFAREWAVVNLAPRHSALLLGRELPRGPLPDAERRYEFLWSAQPELVREAVAAAVRLVGQTAADTAQLLAADLESIVIHRATDPDFATALTSRAIAYLDRTPA